MVKGMAFRFFGILFLFLGATIVFNSFSGITGFVVYEGVDLDTGFLIGVWFVITGILLAAYRNKGEVKKNAKD